MQKKAYLTLSSGQVFEGLSFGFPGESTGELVFTTAMVGYLETLTDPCYYGQIVLQTFPLIGNYGVIPQDLASRKPHLSAYIVRHGCQEPSNFRSEGVLDDFLYAQKIVGLSDIDTRALTKIIREHGVVNAKITQEAPDLSLILPELKAYRIQDAVRAVSTGESTRSSAPEALYRVVLWDFGAKNNTAEMLVDRKCEVFTVPADATAEQIRTLCPDGLVLSNGPGDPAENTGAFSELRSLCMSKIPMFGIGLGHQLMALALGGKTRKLKYGHRGASQPVRRHEDGRIFITNQNHGYEVAADSLPGGAELRFSNVNDGSPEGFRYSDRPAISVQFQPDASSGPLDTGFLYDAFIRMMQEEK